MACTVKLFFLLFISVPFDDRLRLPEGGANTGPSESGSNADENYGSNNESKVKVVPAGDNDLLYIVLGSGLGAMVLLLIVFVAICGFKQRQQRRNMMGKNVGMYVFLK